MDFAHFFEAMMLVCFGFSWPINVIKAIKARSAKGTSLAFIILIITGYVAGIVAKLINHQYNYVLAVYFLNLAIVMMNIAVYIRNKSLDRKAAVKATKPKTLKIDLETKETPMMNYSNSFDELINKRPAIAEKKGSVILLGETSDINIPVEKLAREFMFNFDLYNKSADSVSMENANEYFESNIAKLEPEGMLLHFGENDLNLFMNNAEAFDNHYLELISTIKNVNKKCRLALVSISNPEGNKTISVLNAHIKAIAESEKATYINLENAKLWNPEATKASSQFAYNMGLSVRKPLSDVAEILYSYVYHHMSANATEVKVG